MEINKLLLRKTAIKWVNEYYEKEDYILLKVFRKDLTESYDVLIDKDDFKKVSQGQWYGYMNRKNTHLKNIVEILYTIERKGKKIVYNIYQWILDSKNSGVIVDHINIDRLDNRRSNLRFVTAQENRLNQVCTGWSYDKNKNVYISNIYYNNKSFYLGEYITKEEAEIIYFKACLLIGYSDLSYYHNSKVEILNIIISDEDYKNIYLSKLIKYKKSGIIKDTYNDDIFLQENGLGVGNNSALGYNYDKQTSKYLTRIKINNKETNIGRYDTEKEANEVYLKACLIVGKDKISPRIKERIIENNIELTEDDLKNKYIKKVYILFNNTNEVIENARFNHKYEENMDSIVDMVNKNYNWNQIAKYLQKNIIGLENAKDETVKKKYLNYIEQQNVVI